MVEHEIKVIFDMADLGELPDMTGRLDKEVSIMNESFDEMVGTMREMVVEVDAMLELNTSLLENIKSQLALHADDSTIVAALADSLLDVAANVLEISNVQMFGGQLPELNKLRNQVVKLHDDLTGAGEAATKLGKAFKKMGLDKIVDQMKEFGTLGGQLGFWAGAFREVAKQAGNWRTQNNAIYGGVLEISDAVREAGQETRITQEDAEAAAMALRDMAIAADSFKAATKTVGRFATETGVSAEVAATLYKRMQVLGATGDETDKMFKAMSGTMARFAMNGKSAGTIIDFLNKNLYLLAARLGGGAKAAKAASEGIMLIAAVARSVGMDMSTVSEIFEGLMNDATKFVILLGGALDEADPGLQFITMAGNAGDALKMLEKVPGFLKNKIAKDLYGVGVQGLTEMEKFHETFKKDIGEKAYIELMAKVSAGVKGASEELAEYREAYRESTEPMYAFKVAMGQIFTALYLLIEPLVWVAAKIAFFIGWLGSFGATSRWVYRAIFALGIAFWFLRKRLFGLLGGGAMKEIQDWFGKKLPGALGKSTAAAAKSGKNASALNKFGKGIREFVSQISKISPAKAGKAAFVMVILGSALVALAYGAKLLDIDNLMQTGVGMVTFAGSLWIMTKVIDSVKGSWTKIAMGLVILSAALGVFAFVMHLMDKSGSMTPIEAMCALGVAFVVLAVGSKIMGNAVGSMIKAAIAVGIMGLAMIPMAYAMNLLGEVGWGTFGMMAAMIVVFAVAMAVLSPIAIPMMLTAVAFLIFGAALWVIASAMTEAATAFAIFAELPLLAMAGGLAVLGVAILAAGLMMIIGMPLMLAALAIGALLLPLGLLFWIASIFIKWGLQNILEGVGGDVKNLEIMGNSMLAALGGLAIGIGMLVNSRYWKFWRASKDIAEGMGPLMRLAYWASVLDFAGSTQNVAKSLKNLSDATKSFGPGAGFKASAKAFSDAVWIIGDGIWYYADYVEQAASRVINAVTQVSASAGMLKMFGLDEAIKTSAAVTVKADLEDKNRETADREGQLELLEGIKSALTGIHSSMSKLAGGGDTTEQLNKISDVVTQYLPEIAESGGGLVDATNQWNSSMG
jgi:hypothetical protein